MDINGLASIAAPAEGRPNADDDKAQRLIASPRQDQFNAETDRELAAAVLRQSCATNRCRHTRAKLESSSRSSLTWRGPVHSGAKVADLARQTAGTEKVKDQMSIEKSRVPRKKKRPDA